MTTKNPRYKATKAVFQIEAMSCVTLTLTHSKKGYLVILKVPGKEAVTSPFKTETEAMIEFDRLSAVWSVTAAEAGFPLEYVRRKTGRKIPCPGEAHKNLFIDNCSVCMGGEYGEIDELAPVDLDYAKAARLDIPCFMLTREQNAVMNALEDTGEVKILMVQHTSSSYFVARWL